MSEFFFLALFALFLFGILAYIALFFYNESEHVGNRLRRVSQMLQKAELDTGLPYFTSLGNYLDVENPAMFLIAKKRAVFRPIVEEEEEEEAQEEEAQEEEAQEEEEVQEEEQSPLDKSSDSEQLSDEGEEGVVSDNSNSSNGSNGSNSSQVLPPPPVDLDQYTPLFQIHED